MITDTEFNFARFLISSKKFIKYAKSRIFVTCYTFALSFLFIDIINISYWKFAIFFIPLNFIANYFIFKKAFK